MDMNEVVSLFTNTSVTVVILGYFIFRDWKFMSTLSETLNTLLNTVNSLKEVIQTCNMLNLHKDED